MIKASVRCILTLLCVVLFEMAILSNITVLPSVPDLLLLCIVYIALLNGPTFGCVMAFIGGMMLDCASGSPLGYNSLIRVIIGFAAGWIGRVMYFDGAFLPIVISASCIVAKWAIVLIMSVLFPAVHAIDMRSVSFLFELCTTSIIAPFAFAFLGLFDAMLALPAPLGRKEAGDYR